MSLDDIKWCTCSRCGSDVLGESVHDVPPELVGIAIVAVRIFQRPVCSECIDDAPRPKRHNRLSAGWTVPVVRDPFPGDAEAMGE